MQQPVVPNTTTSSDPYTYPQQYYSQFPTQNPNPYYDYNQQLPAGTDSYYPSYPISYADGFTYTHSLVVPPTYGADDLVHKYAALDGTVPQDASQHLLPAIPTHSSWPNPNPPVQPRGLWKKIPKKKKIQVAQSAWCEICKIVCNTKEVLDVHKLGKKHQKNLGKLNSAASVAGTSATTHVNPHVPSNPIIGPSENPKKGLSGLKNKAETTPDLEKKRRKVVEGGAASSAVRSCSFCNVVCNSDTVFRTHLAGQKHASMLKKIQQAAGTVTGAI